MKLPVLIQAIFLLALLPPAGCAPPSSEPEKGGEPEKVAPSKTVPAPEKTEPANPPAEPVPAEKPEKEPKPAISSAIESLTGSLGYNLDGQEEGDPKAELEKGLSLQKQGRYTKAIEVLGHAAAMKGDESLRAEILLELAETYFRRGKDAQQESLETGEVVEDPDASLETSAVLFKEVARRYKTELDFSTQAAYMAGSCYLLLGDHQRGLKAYKSAFENFPRTSKYRSKALERAGVCYAGIGNPIQARAFFKKYVKDYGADPKFASTAKKIRTRYLNELGLVGRPAPPLNATRWLKGVVDGGLESLRGEVIVLTFFSTWCNHCKSELPQMRRDVEKWSDKGVVFIGIANPSDPKGTSPVEIYVETNKVPFLDVALDEGGRSWRPYRVSGLPAAVVIDQKGIVRWRGHYTFMGHTLLETLLAE
ncbi:MAG: redoxin domain-containing protein [Planctomycetota bacterium]|nr:redoxin domain-containing protein [Planctomycetota bacterium]